MQSHPCMCCCLLKLSQRKLIHATATAMHPPCFIEKCIRQKVCHIVTLDVLKGCAVEPASRNTMHARAANALATCLLLVLVQLVHARHKLRRCRHVHAQIGICMKLVLLAG
jgi:hypothetical protein